MSRQGQHHLQHQLQACSAGYQSVSRLLRPEYRRLGAPGGTVWPEHEGPCEALPSVSSHPAPSRYNPAGVGLPPRARAPRPRAARGDHVVRLARTPRLAARVGRSGSVPLQPAVSKPQTICTGSPAVRRGGPPHSPGVCASKSSLLSLALFLVRARERAPLQAFGRVRTIEGCLREPRSPERRQREAERVGVGVGDVAPVAAACGRRRARAPRGRHAGEQRAAVARGWGGCTGASWASERHSIGHPLGSRSVSDCARKKISRNDFGVRHVSIRPPPLLHKLGT